MAKILFNDELFNISEAALNAASERIMRVLSSVMNGTGATINFGGTTYNIDSTKLSTVTNSFVSHLGTVSGSGMKVSVGGIEYSIDSSKMSNAVSQIHEILSRLQSGGDSGLEMNEYGFYFGVPYVTYDGNNKGMYTFFADGSSNTKAINIESGEVSYDETSPVGGLEYGLNKVIHKESGTVIIEFTDNGTKFELQGAIFTLEADIGGSSSGQHMTVRTSKLNILDTVETTEGVFYKVSNLAPTISEISGATVTMFNHSNCELDTGTISETDCVIVTDGVYVLNDMILIVTADKVDVMTKGAWISAQLVGYAGDRTISVYWGYDEEGIPMNEYGFYFGKKYTKISDKASVSMVFFEDGTVRTIWKDLEAGGDPVYWEDTATYSQGQIVVNGGEPFTVSANGTKIDTGDMILTLEGSDDSGLNQYGFYFNKPYSYHDDTLATTFTWTFYPDGSGKYHVAPNNSAAYDVDYPVGDLIYGQNQIEIVGIGVIDFSDNGTKFEMGGYVFELESNSDSDDYDDEFPIEWNTAEVVNNPSFVWADIPFVKISNLTPSAEELANATINFSMNGMEGTCTYASHSIVDDVVLAFFANDTIDDLAVISSSSATTVQMGDTDIVIPEAGLYVVSIGAIGYNADCTLNIVPSSSDKDPALNPEGVEVINGEYATEDYVYTARMAEGANMFGAATLEEALQLAEIMINEEFGMTWDEFVMFYQQMIEQEMGMTWEEIAAAEGFTGSFEDMVLAEFGLTEETFVPAEVNGWSVRVADTIKTEYDEIFESINGAPVDNLNGTFQYCTSLVVAPTIPSSVINMDNTFEGCTSLTTAPAIPSGVDKLQSTFAGCTNLITPPDMTNATSVTTMHNTFSACTALATAPVIPQGVTSMRYTFSACVNLTTAPAIPSGVIDMASTFSRCTNLKSYIGSTDVDGDFSNYIIPSGVTDMDYTFSDCTYITYAPIIPSGVTNMSGTFRNCTNLISAPIIPSGVTSLNETFKNCTNLKTYIGSTDADGDFSNYVIPSAVKDMDNTFFDCDQIRYAPDMSNANSVISMRSTFSGCSTLTTAPVIPNSVIDMYYTFSNCESLSVAPAIPSGVTNMNHTFNNCESLTTPPDMSNANSVTTLSYTFDSCKALTSAPVIPSGVTELSCAFRHCESLVTPPDMSNANSVINMDQTFFGCDSLTSAPVIPNSVIDMSGAFSYCKLLSRAPAIPENVTNMNRTFEYCTSISEPPDMTNAKNIISMKYTFFGCESLTSAPVIPNSVIDMEYAFYDCKALTIAPVIPNSVTNLDFAFDGCNSIKTYAGSTDPEGDFSHYIIPNGVTSLDQTFADWIYMTVAPSIPNSVTNMHGTFIHCVALITPPVIPSGVTDMSAAFSNCISLISAPAIPSGVTNMSYTFNNCQKMSSASTIPNSVTDMQGTFEQCEKLTGTITIDANPTEYNLCFRSTLKPITLVGSSTMLAQLAATANHGNVTVG